MSGFEILFGQNNMPGKAIEFLVTHGIRPVVKRVIGEPLTESEVLRRTAQVPLHTAILGAEAVRHGIATEDEELQLYGQAMVAKALNNADDMATSTPMHASVAEAVTDIATEVTLSNVFDNPYITPEVAARATDMLNGFHQTDIPL